MFILVLWLTGKNLRISKPWCFFFETSIKKMIAFLEISSQFFFQWYIICIYVNIISFFEKIYNKKNQIRCSILCQWLNKKFQTQNFFLKRYEPLRRSSVFHYVMVAWYKLSSFFLYLIEICDVFFLGKKAINKHHKIHIFLCFLKFRITLKFW